MGGKRDLGILLERAREGDDAALNLLCAELYGPVSRFLGGRLRSSDPQDEVADMVQETLMRVARRIGECRAGGAAQLLGWVFAVARNVLADHLSDPFRALRDYTAAADEVLEGPQACHQLEPEEGAGDLLCQLLVRAYSDLPLDTAHLLWLRIVEGAPWRVIAEDLGSTPAAAKRRYQRAQQALRRDVLRRLEYVSSEERHSIRGRLLGDWRGAGLVWRRGNLG